MQVVMLKKQTVYKNKSKLVFVVKLLTLNINSIAFEITDKGFSGLNQSVLVLCLVCSLMSIIKLNSY